MAGNWFFLMVALITIVNVLAYNKYSAEANAKDKDAPTSLRALDKPYRMNKLNILWSKAQHRLSDPKLKSLYSELKLHDKEEVTWKRLRAEGKDKDGLKEAELRNKLSEIMDLYGLSEHFDEGKVRLESPQSNSAQIKFLFKDKKLNKLWSRAESAGFTSAELSALREEFDHHQEKIDQYYNILNDVKENKDANFHENSVDDKLDRFNMLTEKEEVPQKDYLDKVNLLREQHRDLRDGFDRLHRLASQGPNDKEFVEPKVQGLWKLAIETDFTPDELESLRVELMHYENRLLKLRHMHAEMALNDSRNKEKIEMAGVKSHGVTLMEDNIKKQARKVEKMHLDLETRIMRKHIEL